MDKSRRYKKSIVQAQMSEVRRQRSDNKIRICVLFSVLCFLSSVFHSLDVSGEEVASFHIIAKDLNLLNFESLLKEYFPKIKYDGNISLEAEIKFEKGVNATRINGNFSSSKISFSQANSSLPLTFSNLEGDFEAELTGEIPQIKGKIRSSEVNWERLSLQNMEADYNLFEKKLDIKNCKVGLDEGTVYLNGNIDFTKSPPIFFVKLTSEKVNIGSISERWDNARPISGILFADGDLSGELGKPTTYSGKAKVRIEEGDLGKIGLFGRLITFSPLATIIQGSFSELTLEGDFNISEGYASTENTVIKGPSIKITAKGDVGWNKKLDFILSFYASSEVLKKTLITKALGVIVDDFGNVLRRVKLTGTIDNPQFTIVPLGIGNAIIEGLEKSFGRGSPDTKTP